MILLIEAKMEKIVGMKTTRSVVASAQGEVIHIKSKKTGQVILKLKLVRDGRDEELLIDFSDLHTSYLFDQSARRKIKEFEER